MGVESEADRLFFVNEDDFGVKATVDGIEVSGIFDDGYFDALDRDNNPVEGRQITFMCPTASLPAPAHGQTVVVSGATYFIRNVRPDGTGYTTLELRES